MAKKQNNYVSEIDTFLSQLRAKFPVSPSQKAEIEKYRKVGLRRDHKVPPLNDEFSVFKE